MRYLIIGLGIFGANLARNLTDMGHEVIGADRSAPLVEAIKEQISAAYIVDSTDEAGLSALPIKGVDLVIVAIGENFGASIKTVALLKKLGVQHIYARAADELHRAILQGLQIDRIITPEQRAARDLSLELAFGNQVESLAVGGELYAVRLGVPARFVGQEYGPLREELSRDFGITLVAATRQQSKRNLLGITSQAPAELDLSSATVTPADQWLIYGTRRAIFKSALGGE